MDFWIYGVMRNKVKKKFSLQSSFIFSFTSYTFVFNGPLLGKVADITTEETFS